MFRTASIIINDYQRSSKLKLALACDIQTRYPSRLWILLFLAELNLFLKEMTALAYGQQCILTSVSLYIRDM